MKEFSVIPLFAKNIHIYTLKVSGKFYQVINLGTIDIMDKRTISYEGLPCAC